MANKLVGTRFHPTTYKELKAYAKLARMTVPGVVKLAVETYLREASNRVQLERAK